MPDEGNENEKQNTENEATDPQPTEAPATADPKNYRYTAEDGVADWMVGKTPTEVAQVANQMAETLQNYDPQQQNVNQSGQNVQQQRQQYQQAQQQVTGQPQNQPQPPDPDLQFDNPAEWQRQWQQYQENRTQQMIQQAAGTFGQSMGQMARSTVANEMPDVFGRWGHEVDKLLADNGVSMMNRSPDTYRMAAKIIKADHVDEIVNDRIEKRAPGSPNATERTRNAGSPAEVSNHGDVVDEFWESDHPYVQRIRSDGLSKSDFRRSIKQMNQKPETYIENLKNQRTITTSNTFTTEDVAQTRSKQQA